MHDSWENEQLQDREHEHSDVQLLLWTRGFWKHPHLDSVAMAIKLESVEKDRKIMAFELLKLRKQFVSDRVMIRKVTHISEQLVEATNNAFEGEIHNDKRPKHY